MASVKRELIVKTFDYKDIDPDTKGKLICLAGEINRAAFTHVEAALGMGEAISSAHHLLAGIGRDGLFKPWVELECGISRSTAYNYMWAWDRFGKCKGSLDTFTSEAMYALAAPTAPKEAAKEAEKLASKGVRITVERAKEIISKFRKAANSAGTRAEPASPPAAEARPAPAPTAEPSAPPKAKKPATDFAPPPAPTPQERMAEWNKLVEAFARSITALADEAPEGGWWDESQQGITAGQLKSAAGSARQAKCDNICPLCEGEGCDRCKGTGFMPRRTYEMAGGK